MAKKKESAPGAAKVKQRVKVSKVKVRKASEVRPFYSQPGTKPLRDVIVRDKDGTKELFLEGMTEEEMINQGVRQPYYQHVSFKKSKEEREEVLKLKRNNPKLSGWIGSDTNKNEFATSTLIVHLKNTDKDNLFKTTYSFKEVKATEVAKILDLFFISKFNTKTNKGPRISCYFYKGQRLNVKK